MGATIDATPATATGSASVPSRPVSGSAWPVVMVLAGYPPAWIVGLGPVVFMVGAVVMALWLVRHRPVLIPPGTIMFALFLVLVAASVVQVDSVGRIGLWVLRSSWYTAAFVTWIFLARQTSIPARRLIVHALIATWAMTIVGGYAAMIAPDLSWSTPLSRLLPGVIADDEFVGDLIRPSLAEIQTFYPDIRLDRPAAPYAYTNAWGSSVALLTPFVLAALHERRLRLPAWIVAGALGIGLVPFYHTLNRGAWLTLGLGTVYGVVRYAAVTRRLKPILVLLAAGVVALTMATATGLADTAIERLEARSQDSNETRAGIYVETLRESARSPIIGFGTPRPSATDPSGPPLGTHGQLWAVLFAHGYLAAGLYVGFFLFAFVRARGRDPVSHWAKVTLAVGLLQLPVYGHVPTQVFVLVTAAAIASWPADAVGPEPEPGDR